MLFCVFFVVFVFYFALSGVMLMYERTSIDRKKERNRDNGGKAGLWCRASTFLLSPQGEGCAGVTLGQLPG